MPQSYLRLFHVASDTRVTDEECDQGTLQMQRTRSEKNCFRLLDTLGAPN
jgi:hypothetical protein